MPRLRNGAHIAIQESVPAAPQAAKGILGMMANVLVTLDGPAAAAMAGTVTTTCLGALTALSEGQGEEGTGHDEQGAFGVEEAAVGAFVALALRLPEREFRPQFQRVVQWGTAQGPSGPMPARRVGSLFSVAHALAQRLRSVFVPYFAGLWGTACVALGAPAEAVAGEEGKGKKKREKKKRRGTEAAVEGSGEEMARMRVSVLRALASCFVADTVGFVTMERVESLLPGIAAQLAEESPAAGMGEWEGPRSVVGTFCTTRVLKDRSCRLLSWGNADASLLAQERSLRQPWWRRWGSWRWCSRTTHNASRSTTSASWLPGALSSAPGYWVSHV